MNKIDKIIGEMQWQEIKDKINEIIEAINRIEEKRRDTSHKKADAERRSTFFKP